jgi:hypothetical protein
MRYGPLLNTVGTAASYRMKDSSPKQNMRADSCRYPIGKGRRQEKTLVSTNVAASSYSSRRRLRLVPLLNPLIQRLQHTGIHRGDHVRRSIQFFFGHPCFPCVRKAALHSRIAKAHHRDGESHEHFLTLRQAIDGMCIAVESSEIGFLH